jgi:hypothetical protein
LERGYQSSQSADVNPHFSPDSYCGGGFGHVYFHEKVVFIKPDVAGSGADGLSLRHANLHQVSLTLSFRVSLGIGIKAINPGGLGACSQIFVM